MKEKTDTLAKIVSLDDFRKKPKLNCCPECEAINFCLCHLTEEEYYAAQAAQDEQQ